MRAKQGDMKGRSVRAGSRVRTRTKRRKCESYESETPRACTRAAMGSERPREKAGEEVGC